MQQSDLDRLALQGRCRGGLRAAGVELRGRAAVRGALERCERVGCADLAAVFGSSVSVCVSQKLKWANHLAGRQPQNRIARTTAELSV